MRTTLAVSAALLLAGAAYLPAHAQSTPQGSTARTPVQGPSHSGMQTPAQPQSQLPQGSFQSTCRDARMANQTLIAFCQKSDGSWQTSAIGPVSQCVGDLQNVNGRLTCNETGYGSSTPPAPRQARTRPVPPQH
jgi:hypothetical protein